MQAKDQVKKAVLRKQDEACSDKKCKSASGWADRSAHKHEKAMYGYGTTPLDFNI